MTERFGPSYIPEDANSSPIRLTELIDLSPFSEQEPRHTAVIVLGQSTRRVPGLEQNFVTKMCTIAAVSFAKSLGGESICFYIISREAEELKKLARDTGLDSVKGKIIVDKRSGSTPKQGKTLAELLKNENYSNTILVVPSIQSRRASRVLRAWGVELGKTVSAEEKYINDPDISEEEREKRKKEIELWHGSINYKWDQLKEAALEKEQFFDKKQQWPMRFVSLTRKKKSP